MATMTISLPDTMKDWVETQIGAGEYASASDYVRDLIRRDKSRQLQDFTREDLQRKLMASRHSGVSPLTVDEIFMQAQSRANGRNDA